MKKSGKNKKLGNYEDLFFNLFSKHWLMGNLSKFPNMKIILVSYGNPANKQIVI